MRAYIEVGCPAFCLNLFIDLFQIKTVPTQPIEGQKTGTSGLRKKVRSLSATLADNVWRKLMLPSLFDRLIFAADR